MSQWLEVWTVYDRPRDCPHLAVARKHYAKPNGATATDEVTVGASVEEVRRRLPPGLVCVPRSPEDDPCVVETWL